MKFEIQLSSGGKAKIRLTATADGERAVLRLIKSDSWRLSDSWHGSWEGQFFQGEGQPYLEFTPVKEMGPDYDDK